MVKGIIGLIHIGMKPGNHIDPESSFQERQTLTNTHLIGMLMAGKTRMPQMGQNHGMIAQKRLGIRGKTDLVV